MRDPILTKLMADALAVLVDTWRALRRLPPVEDWRKPKSGEWQPEAAPAEYERPSPDGLCYFHLN